MEVSRFYEDDFYHVPDLQYYVHRLKDEDITMERLLMPKSIFRGYNLRNDGQALYWNMHVIGESFWGQYRTWQNKTIDFWTRFADLRIHMNYGAGQVMLDKVGVREAGIALEVQACRY